MIVLLLATFLAKSQMVTPQEVEAGRIDVLFANAGGGGMLPLGQITQGHIEGIFDRNVTSVIFTVQKALPLLARDASVILTGSRRQHRGRGRIQRLFGVEGGRPQSGKKLGAGSEGGRNPRQRGQPRSDPHAFPSGPCG